MAEEKSTANPFLGSKKSDTVSPPFVSEKKPDQIQTDPLPVVPLSTSTNDSGVTSPERVKRLRVLRKIGFALAAALIIAALLFWWFRSTPTITNNPINESAEENIMKATPSLPAIKTDPITPALEGNANYVSENFKAGEIVIGGELQVLMDEAETGTLVIENIRGEAFTERNKKEVKLVVTWTTNALSQATISYSKGVGQTERSVEENDYSYNHSVIISGLDPASTYLYAIVATDRFGNRTQSEPHAVFTGARTVSLFDLIAGAIGEVFGWAVTNK